MVFTRGPTARLWGRTLGGATNTTAGSLLISLPNNNLVSILSSRQLGGLRHREVKYLVRGHTARKWRSWDPGPGSGGLGAALLTTVLPCLSVLPVSPQRPPVRSPCHHSPHSRSDPRVAPSYSRVKPRPLPVQPRRNPGAARVVPQRVPPSVKTPKGGALWLVCHHQRGKAHSSRRVHGRAHTYPHPQTRACRRVCVCRLVAGPEGARQPGAGGGKHQQRGGFSPRIFLCPSSCVPWARIMCSKRMGGRAIAHGAPHPSPPGFTASASLRWTETSERADRCQVLGCVPPPGAGLWEATGGRAGLLQSRLRRSFLLQDPSACVFTSCVDKRSPRSPMSRPVGPGPARSPRLCQKPEGVPGTHGAH